jgi:hypothetical protein
MGSAPKARFPVKQIVEAVDVQSQQPMLVSIKYAKIHLARLITRAMRGEEIIICRGRIPLVRLEPVPAPKSKKRPQSG